MVRRYESRSDSKRSPEVAERIPGLHVYKVNCLSRVEVRARLWGFRSDNGDVPGMAQGHPVRSASSGLRLLMKIHTAPLCRPDPNRSAPRRACVEFDSGCKPIPELVSRPCGL